MTTSAYRDLVAFECDRELIEDRRGYALELMERPPDLVLEVASPTTGVTDYTDKHLDCARYAIPECWGLDPSGGDHYDDALAGDGLVDGVYEPQEVERLGEGVWRGYSETLGLHVCWEHGRLRFLDPMTERYLPVTRRSLLVPRRMPELDVTVSPGQTVKLLLEGMPRSAVTVRDLRSWTRGARGVRQFALSLSDPPRLT